VLVAVTRKSDDRVVVAVDPHKASWTAAAVDGSLQPLATVRVPVSRDGYRALRRSAPAGPMNRPGFQTSRRRYRLSVEPHSGGVRPV